MDIIQKAKFIIALSLSEKLRKFILFQCSVENGTELNSGSHRQIHRHKSDLSSYVEKINRARGSEVNQTKHAMGTQRYEVEPRNTTSRKQSHPIKLL